MFVSFLRQIDFVFWMYWHSWKLRLFEYILTCVSMKQIVKWHFVKSNAFIDINDHFEYLFISLYLYVSIKIIINVIPTNLIIWNTIINWDLDQPSWTRFIWFLGSCSSKKERKYFGKYLVYFHLIFSCQIKLFALDQA